MILRDQGIADVISRLPGTVFLTEPSPFDKKHTCFFFSWADPCSALFLAAFSATESIRVPLTDFNLVYSRDSAMLFLESFFQWRSQASNPVHAIVMIV
jgi:hypothetical protein